jgi:hypothetical protein
VSDDLQCASPHAVVSAQNAVSSGGTDARCLGGRTGSVCSGASFWDWAYDDHELEAREQERMPKRYMNAPHLAISPFPICNWMNCERDCAATRRFSGSGWPSIRQAKCIPVWLLGPRTQRVAHLLIHRLREQLVPDCLPLFV